MRWAKALKLESKEITKIENSIGSSLFYKYLKTKHPIIEIAKSSNLKLAKKGKILFVDDELDKGWINIFKKITENLPSDSIDFCVSVL